MNIEISTDKNIDGGEKFSSYVTGVVEQAIKGFNAKFTHIGVHFSDQNSSKTGIADKRCVLELRMAGKGPTAVTSYANTVDEALMDAVEKMKSSVERTIGKMKRH